MQAGRGVMVSHLGAPGARLSLCFLRGSPSSLRSQTLKWWGVRRGTCGWTEQKEAEILEKVAFIQRVRATSNSEAQQRSGVPR